MALPMLEAMTPARLFAAGGTGAAKAFPKRMAFIYIPNGANMADWTPTAVGTDFELPKILEPLEPFRKDFHVISGLAHDKARPNGDGPGDHARASASFLTGCQARKTAGADIKMSATPAIVAPISSTFRGRRNRRRCRRKSIRGLFSSGCSPAA